MVFIPSRHVALTIVPHVHTRLPTSVKVLIMMMTKGNEKMMFRFISEWFCEIFLPSGAPRETYQLSFVICLRSAHTVYAKIKAGYKTGSKNLTPLCIVTRGSGFSAPTCTSTCPSAYEQGDIQKAVIRRLPVGPVLAPCLILCPITPMNLHWLTRK